MEAGQQVSYVIKESIGIITLDSPPGNYLPVPAFISTVTFSEIVADQTLKGLIIHGKGRNFSAGGDLQHILRAASQSGKVEPLLKEGHALFSAIENLDLPVIAAIKGVCFGGGLELALACHIRIASENALFAFPEVNQGLIPGMGGTFRVPLMAGLSEAMLMILGGDTMRVDEAFRLGIIDRIVPNDPFTYAWDLMMKMTHDKPVKVIRYAMKAFQNSRILSDEEAAMAESRMFCELASEEVKRRRLKGEK